MTVLSGEIRTVGGMPWKATDAMKERTKLVLDWEPRREGARAIAPVNGALL